MPSPSTIAPAEDAVGPVAHLLARGVIRHLLRRIVDVSSPEQKLSPPAGNPLEVPAETRLHVGRESG